MRVIFVLSGLLAAQLPGQEGPDRTDELHALLTATVRTEADVSARVKGCQAWLQRVRAVKGERVDFLRVLAGYYGTRDEAVRRGFVDRLAASLAKSGDRVPAPRFRSVVGRMMLWYGVSLTNGGEFATARRELPRILAFQDDRRSAFWLMGRRGRDHADASGREFLQQTIIPTILSDHSLDDPDRVYLLRRLYAVDYTGPKPFRHIEGPVIGGGRVSSADFEGSVSLILYWGTW